MQYILDINLAAYEFLSNQDKSLVSNILLGMESNELIQVLQDKQEQLILVASSTSINVEQI